MPGEPAETMIGVAAVGFGVLLGVAAFKNKNPIAIIQQAVTTGSLDLSKVPDLISTGVRSQGNLLIPADVTAAIGTIAAKDPTLATQISAEIAGFDINTPYSKTKHFFDLMSQARVEGFATEATTIEAYVNRLVPASTTTGTGGVVNI
jgi:hypothetical protein